MPPSGTAVIEQRRFADRDGFAASFRMARGIFHRSLNQYAGRALAKRSSGKVFGQLQIEPIGPIGVRLSFGRPPQTCDIHAGRFDGDLSVIHRLAEEVVGAHAFR